MFTGIITDIGMLKSTEGDESKRLVIGTAYDVATIAIGASIACNGVCLTVVEKGEGFFAADASPTTLSVTTMGSWNPGQHINLERALKVGDELGGHIVSGHVDGVAEVLDCSRATPAASPMERGSGLAKSPDFASSLLPPFVLEMSSFQLDLMQTVHFNAAVWLNITPDHLDRHGDMEGYIAAKKHIFERQAAGDVAIIGIDDAYSEAVARELIAGGKQTVVPVTVGGKASHGIEVADGILLDRRDNTRIDLNTGKLKGAHNWQNIAAAYAACRGAGVNTEIISQAILSFGGLEHRMEWVKSAGGATFVNDSKATNADSTSKALAAYPSDIYWIAGGRPKAGGITTLGQYFPRIAHAYLLGEAEEEFAGTLQGHIPFTRCGTLEAATRKAAEDALRAGKGVVLLSPACASWDQWPNFEARGQAFKEYVKEIVDGYTKGGQEADPALSSAHPGAQEHGAGASI